MGCSSLTILLESDSMQYSMIRMYIRLHTIHNNSVYTMYYYVDPVRIQSGPDWQASVFCRLHRWFTYSIPGSSRLSSTCSWLHLLIFCLVLLYCWCVPGLAGSVDRQPPTANPLYLFSSPHYPFTSTSPLPPPSRCVLSLELPSQCEVRS